MITGSRTFFKKAALASALLHVGIFGTVSYLSLPDTPVHLPKQQSISIHFVPQATKTSTSKPAPKKIIKRKTKKLQKNPIKESTHKKKAASQDCPCATQPIRIEQISCEGAYMPKPLYPKAALKRQLTGVVEIAFTLGCKGTVTAANILQSSQHPLLDQAALKAIYSWTFPQSLAHKHPNLIAPIRFVLTS